MYFDCLILHFLFSFSDLQSFVSCNFGGHERPKRYFFVENILGNTHAILDSRVSQSCIRCIYNTLYTLK